MNNKFHLESTVTEESFARTKVCVVAKSNGNQEMGTLSFLLENKKIWFFYVETYEPFQHMGVATAMVEHMEAFAQKNHIKHIEGRFFPSNEFAKPFYNKLGYDIFQDGYEWFVTKDLNQTKEIQQENNF